MLTLLDHFYHHARTRGDDPAYHEFSPTGERQRTISYSELAEWSEWLAARLRRCAPSASVVLICLGNRIECVVSTLATLSAGHTALLVSAQVSEPELMGAARQSGAAVSLADGCARQGLEQMGLVSVSPKADKIEYPMAYSAQEIPTPAPQDCPGLMLLSSGSTGDPKIVFRDGASLDAVSANMVESIGMTRNDRVLMLLPLCHSYGFEHGFLAPIYAGCTVHLCSRLDAGSLLNQWHQDAVTVFPGVPSIFELLATSDAAQPAKAMRCAYSAGAPLPDSVYQQFRKRTGVQIGQLYGSTEVGSITYHDPNTADYEPTCVGVPMRGVEIRIVHSGERRFGQPSPTNSEGEVAVRAPSMLSYYVGDPAPPFRDGYYMTGDLGRMDDTGRLHITGRLKLLIDVGGLKVNPLEVESVLARHPLVREAVVVPVQVTDTVCRLKAVIVPSGAAPRMIAKELRSFVRQHLSAYKVPRIFEVRDSLPRTTTGKLKRSELAGSAALSDSGRCMSFTLESRA
jgi:long-chain acyl-CoA synthetase